MKKPKLSKYTSPKQLLLVQSTIQLTRAVTLDEQGQQPKYRIMPPPPDSHPEQCRLQILPAVKQS